ncbi:protein glucosyltransferase [Apostasia shenzhenica]|uniref:Protein glucosyltransferase n=1 Tax=Apostasia shenzhenica TaxID=1088818 RepID=A0A2I0AXF1_9ASPA|nr:protein glucosyltransferase [Apostasia shenzhenica]
MGASTTAFFRLGGSRRYSASSSTSVFTLLLLLSSFLIFLKLIDSAVKDVASRTRTVAGHNLEATPWHPFDLDERRLDLSASRIFHCSYLSCLGQSRAAVNPSSSSPPVACTDFFRAIHRDLEPWRRSRVSLASLAESRKYAAMRVVILGGTGLYLDLYYSCVQSRAMFTVWGLLQLLRRYPGMIPDVDFMLDCMDRPAINRTEYDPTATGGPPPPLFRYCTTKGHFDIPFPDWSFWGWPEVNIKPWHEQFKEIKLGSQSIPWHMKEATAYWKGNPDVQSPIRVELLNCNDTKQWKAQIMRQDWVQESNSGFQNSKLSNQCKHRYKIYAEGFAWSVSLKYILSCGSISLIIDPQYEDFFSRGLIAKENYIPISLTNLCPSIKSAVNWGNKHPSAAEAMGMKGQKLMEELSMDRVYDYMFHLLVEYSKLQDFKPAIPPSAQEVCVESVLCFAGDQRRELLEKSSSRSASTAPCTLPPPESL